MNSVDNRSLCRVGLLAFLVMALSTPAARAQFGRPAEGGASFIEAPRSVSQYLREAERAIEDKRYSDAVIRLGDLLEGTANTGEDEEVVGQDYFLSEAEAQRGRVRIRNTSLLGQAREMLADLPETGWEIYQLRYGPAAQKALEEAVAQHDLEGLRDVRRRFFHTTAGYHASFLLAQDALLQGHPLAASLLLDGIVAIPRAINTLGDAVVLMHASACQLAGRDLPTLEPRAEFVSVDEERQSWPDPEELSAWVRRNYGTTDGSTSNALDAYPLSGATPQRNGGSAGEMPLSMEYWTQRAAESPRQERKVRETTENLTQLDKLPPPSWSPIRVGDYLVMRSTEHVFGVDFETGKLVWEFPWSSPSENHRETEIDFDEDDPDDLLVQRIWNDLPYGQVSSDGERVYLLHDLAEVEVANFGLWAQRGRRPGKVSANTLVALTLESEGKLAWSLGTGEETPSPFSDAFFLGPPLPIDGRLYVLVELAGDISLCCLDPRTGEEYWRQQLVAIESMGINTDPIRRVAGAVPTYHEGVLICPTSSSAVVAIDLADRTLRWGAQLSRNKTYGNQGIGSGRVDQMQLLDRWADGLAVASETNVLVTPIESDRIYCLDLLTGQPCFDGQPRSQFRYLAGIRDDHYFLVGDDVVEARELSSGRRVWETASDLVASGQKISGRGMFGDDEYILPTNTNELIRLSLKDGSVLERRTTSYPLGNLVAVDGMIISQSATDVVVAEGEASLEPEVEETLRRDPDDFDALIGKAQLLIQRKQREQALDVLDKLRQMQPENDQVRLLSVVAMLGMLRESPADHANLIPLLDELIDQPVPRAELITLRVRASLAQGNYDEVILSLIGLSDLVGERHAVPPSFEAIVSDQSRQCSINSWIAARVDDIVEQATDEQLQELNRLVKQQMAAVQNGSGRLLQRLINHFGALKGTEPIREALNERARQDGETFLMERLAWGNHLRGDLDSLSNQRLFMLGDAYARGQFHADAFAVATALRRRGAGALADELTARPGVSGAGAIAALWPRSATLDWTPSVNTRRRRRIMAQTQRRYPPIQLAFGSEMQSRFLVRQSQGQLLIGGPNGTEKPLPVEGSDNQRADVTHAVISGGVMLVTFSDRIQAFNLHSLLTGEGAEILWTISNGLEGAANLTRTSEMNEFHDQRFVYKLPSNVRNTAGATPRAGIGGVVAGRSRPEFSLGPVIGDSLLIHKGSELVCVDLLTGKQLWQNSLAPPTGTVVSDGERVAVVSPRYQQVAYFDLLDGQVLDRKRWNRGEVWLGAGQHVLRIVPSDGSPSAGPPQSYQVELFDPFTETTVLRLVSPPANRRGKDVPASYSHVLDGRFFTLLDTSGVATVWDLFHGTEIARVEGLPRYADLNGLRSVALDGQILLFPKRRKLVKNASGTSTLQTSSSPNCERADAAIAIDLETGDLRWKVEFEQPWGVTLEQPHETPLLPLVRAWSEFQTTGQRVRELEVLALDVRDGSELVSHRKQVPRDSSPIDTEVTVLPGRQRVRCEIGDEVLAFNYAAPTGTEASGEAVADDAFNESDPDDGR